MSAFLYRILTNVGAPLIDLYLRRRMRRGREDATRFSERLGVAAQPRPDGSLVWCHAASVGESVSLLALIDVMKITWPQLHILVTTGTVTSARLLADRLPHGVVHQYIPVDRMPYVQRFLDHWRPDAALWVESELWPNMLAVLRARRIPAVLINGRMSEKSFQNWRYAPRWIAEMFSAFDLCLAQSDDEAKRFSALGAAQVECLGNLKFAAHPLPCNIVELQKLQDAVGVRPLWVMASTHAGEEDIAARVHEKLRHQFPNLLTVIVPRHAVRGDAIAQNLVAQNLNVARRSRNENITNATEIYLADTMGELGLFYRLCPIVVMGGSFVPVGGHNPIEPAQLGAAIIFGMYIHNFTAMVGEFLERHAAVQVADESALAVTLAQLLRNQADVQNLAHAARHLAADKHQVLDVVMQRLAPFFARALRIPTDGAA